MAEFERSHSLKVLKKGACTLVGGSVAHTFTIPCFKKSHKAGSNKTQKNWLLTVAEGVRPSGQLMEGGGMFGEEGKTL